MRIKELFTLGTSYYTAWAGTGQRAFYGVCVFISTSDILSTTSGRTVAPAFTSLCYIPPLTGCRQRLGDTPLLIYAGLHVASKQHIQSRTQPQNPSFPLSL